MGENFTKMAKNTLARLEKLLQDSKLDNTLRRARLELPDVSAASTGIGSLDAALGGGWRRGHVSEIVGGRSSGRTSTMVASMAAATGRGELVGLVDAFDRFDPASAAAAGVVLDQVLWVRGPACTLESARPGLVDRAVRQAIRALDLMLRGGGFGLAVLDLSDVPALFFRALPSATWMRLARACERRQTACVIVADRPVGRSALGVTVRLVASGRWTGDSPQRRRLDALDVRSTVGQVCRPACDEARWALPHEAGACAPVPVNF